MKKVSIKYWLFTTIGAWQAIHYRRALFVGWAGNITIPHESPPSVTLAIIISAIFSSTYFGKNNLILFFSLQYYYLKSRKMNNQKFEFLFLQMDVVPFIHASWVNCRPFWPSGPLWLGWNGITMPWHMLTLLFCIYFWCSIYTYINRTLTR